MGVLSLPQSQSGDTLRKPLAKTEDASKEGILFSSALRRYKKATPVAPLTPEGPRQGVVQEEPWGSRAASRMSDRHSPGDDGGVLRVLYHQWDQLGGRNWDRAALPEQAQRPYTHTHTIPNWDS